MASARALFSMVMIHTSEILSHEPRLVILESRSKGLVVSYF